MDERLRNALKGELAAVEQKTAELEHELAVCRSKRQAMAALLGEDESLAERWFRREDAAKFKGRPAAEYPAFLRRTGTWQHLSDFKAHFRQIGHPHAESVMKDSIPGNLLASGEVVRHPSRRGVFGLPEWLEGGATRPPVPPRQRRQTLAGLVTEAVRKDGPLTFKAVAERIKVSGRTYGTQSIRTRLSELTRGGVLGSRQEETGKVWFHLAPGHPHRDAGQ